MLLGHDGAVPLDPLDPLVTDPARFDALVASADVLARPHRKAARRTRARRWLAQRPRAPDVAKGKVDGAACGKNRSRNYK